MTYGRGWDSPNYSGIPEALRYCDWCGVKLAPTSQVTKLVRERNTMGGTFPTAWGVSRLDSTERICLECSRKLEDLINNQQPYEGWSLDRAVGLAEERVAEREADLKRKQSQEQFAKMDEAERIAWREQAADDVSGGKR